MAEEIKVFRSSSDMTDAAKAYSLGLVSIEQLEQLLPESEFAEVKSELNL
jgi:hypothetical protein